MLYGQDRNDMRQVFFRAWQKYRDGKSLEGAERLIVAVALRHAEYQNLLDRPESGADRDWLPESGETNPFLHMGMHIAIEEQLTIDQPHGIRQQYERLCRQFGDDHAAQHRMMECLGEMLWHAGRNAAQPDMQAYLDCLKRTDNMPSR